jgi:hypothetical protein
MQRLAAIAFHAAVVCACDPTVIVGTRFCATSVPADAGATPDPDASVPSAWSTGFEDGFCDYALPLGFCYSVGPASYSVVTSPVHSGQYAAAFALHGVADAGVAQVRCVQQGVFPSAAYYGAWYYVPAWAKNSDNWNLLHFRGTTGQNSHNLWEVSLVNLGDGGPLHVTFFDDLARMTADTSAAPPIPIGQWFHLEVYFKRAKDTTGELSLWQDGLMAMHLTGLVTDDTDWEQWYVGNLASALAPPASTVYVDDVTISSTP